MRQRIVITGIGGLCGLGNDAASIWRAMRDGRSAIGTLSGELTEGMKIKTGCAIDALPDHGLDRRRTVSMDRFSLFAVIAAREALAHSGLVVDEKNTYRVGAAVGVGVFGAITTDENYKKLLIEQKPRAEIFAVPKIMPGAPRSTCAIRM